MAATGLPRAPGKIENGVPGADLVTLSADREQTSTSMKDLRTTMAMSWPVAYGSARSTLPQRVLTFCRKVRHSGEDRTRGDADGTSALLSTEMSPRVIPM